MARLHRYCNWECSMIKERCPNHGIDISFFHLRTGTISLQVFSTLLQTRAASWTSEHADWTKAVCLTWATKWGYHIPKVPLLIWQVRTFFKICARLRKFALVLRIFALEFALKKRSRFFQTSKVFTKPVSSTKKHVKTLLRRPLQQILSNQTQSFFPPQLMLWDPVARAGQVTQPQGRQVGRHVFETVFGLARSVLLWPQKDK